MVLDIVRLGFLAKLGCLNNKVCINFITGRYLEMVGVVAGEPLGHPVPDISASKHGVERRCRGECNTRQN